MGTSTKLLIGLLALLAFGLATAFAQCSTTMLAALDEERMSFNVSVRTDDPHCIANGTVYFECNPRGAVTYERESENWWGWCFGISANDDISQNPIVAVTMPPGVPFQLIARVEYTDLVLYPTQIKEEMVWVNPGSLRLEIYRGGARCMDNVPVVLEPGSYCFFVCHKVYRIPIAPQSAREPIGEPIVYVTPGCLPPDPCPDLLCPPGDPGDFIYFVYYEFGQWWLYFEYSNALVEPVCYCVDYRSSIPFTCATHALAAFNEETQCFEITNWNDGSCGAGFTREFFSFPPGAYVSEGLDNDCDETIGEYHHKAIPVGQGSYMPGETFQLVAWINYDTLCPSRPPDYHDQWLIESVRVLPDGGLERVSTGNCQNGGGDNVPTSMSVGDAACFIVCHRHYYVHLETVPNGYPIISIASGCSLPCASPHSCSGRAGNLWDCWWAIERWGNEYYLHFEYSNEQREPVCYCVSYVGMAMGFSDVYALGALDEREQNLEITLWTSAYSVLASGEITFQSNPPGAYFDHPSESFFDVFTEYYTVTVGVGPGSFLPGQNFQLVAEIGVHSLPTRQIPVSVHVTPSGVLERWDPATPCTFDMVPPTMNPGESACFTVCHGIYDVIMNAPPGAGEPLVRVVPGCHDEPNPECNMAPFCDPGAPTDYCYRFYRDPFGVWHMEFEYSNPLHEPVCYCVTYVGNLPPCDAHELLCLDEDRQTLDLTLWSTSEIALPCTLSGFFNIISDPPGAYIGPYIGEFGGVDGDWWTAKVNVGPGSFPPGEAFRFIAHVDYVDPPFPDVWLTEEVVVADGDPPYLWINDTGGECTFEDVPPYGMSPGMAYCFHVCHRVYHIPIYTGSSDIRPSIVVTPGCHGMPFDHCESWECIPGGLLDYRWEVYPSLIGQFWELEFEYSNPDVEPVCYCVYVEPLPCDSVTDLVIFYQYGDLSVPQIHLYWTAPQFGRYHIWSTDLPNNHWPGLEWIHEGAVHSSPGLAHWVRPLWPNDYYRNFLIVSECGPTGGLRK